MEDDEEVRWRRSKYIFMNRFLFAAWNIWVCFWCCKEDSRFLKNNYHSVNRYATLPILHFFCGLSNLLKIFERLKKNFYSKDIFLLTMINRKRMKSNTTMTVRRVWDEKKKNYFRLQSVDI